MIYFPDPSNQYWNQELHKVLPYLQTGLWADVGCGGHTVFPHMLTVDWFHPDAQYKAPADALPFEAESLDGVYGSHILEHLENPLGTIREWLRVVKPLGYVVVVHPDRRGTPARGSEHFDSQHKGEYTAEELYELVTCLEGVSVVNRDFEALTIQPPFPWSFKLILRKHGRG